MTEGKSCRMCQDNAGELLQAKVHVGGIMSVHGAHTACNCSNAVGMQLLWQNALRGSGFLPAIPVAIS